MINVILPLLIISLIMSKHLKIIVVLLTRPKGGTVDEKGRNPRFDCPSAGKRC